MIIVLSSFEKQKANTNSDTEEKKTRLFKKKLTCGSILMMILSTCSSGPSSWHATAMLIAVSSLSPVSIHTFTPAPCRASTHVPTPSCSLSSIAVHPSSRRFVSTFGKKPVSQTFNGSKRGDLFGGDDCCCARTRSETQRWRMNAIYKIDCC